MPEGCSGYYVPSMSGYSCLLHQVPVYFLPIQPQQREDADVTNGILRLTTFKTPDTQYGNVCPKHNFIK